ncbi:RNA polymerase factor sigma-54 [Xanthocytophaga agilis]|uniref:RNA polymerase factor sigma-54 n=1 Tax=Xanthocytophaga agilis TaxID=3048010 RepID=A0AAE3QYF6_9BACT|nr:RNA polymerase factor sigma-54 [Xanthocytophaga agilis]MDJ1499775.1 RNA polymerase factor sigma-54 [Xanthocytophaga agilis]
MLKQTQVQKQGLRIAPTHIQMLNLLHLSTDELVQQIQKELEENPALEEGATVAEETESDVVTDEFETDDMYEDTPVTEELYDWDSLVEDDLPNYKTQVNNYTDQEEYSRPIPQAKSFREELKDQIHFLPLTERQQQIAEFILDSIDDDGYLRYSSEDLADDISFSLNVFINEEEIESIRKLIQHLDPPGIGARDLQECLLLQLSRRETDENVLLACTIVEDYMHEIETGNYDRIVRLLGLDYERMQEVLKLISSLQPKPIYSDAATASVNEYIVPDFILQYENGSIRVILNSKNAPELRLSRAMLDIAQGKAKTDKSTYQFVKNKVDSARWFIDAIQQRENTMLSTMNAILQLQYDYFVSGEIVDLKPMILKDIADMIGMDISTISRVTSTRYVQTPFGIIPLKQLFTEKTIREDGEEVSTMEVKEMIADIIENEDKNHTLSDKEIVDLLVSRGYSIARRTVVKYRDQLNIPSAKLRKWTDVGKHKLRI